ncbi:uncharacterized protein MONOS_10092 [Monocercomonoides exilis]|uniref:uncharacterized protein n=1 Tax=Monocercomonoides exilis TaxID=2049356 RepID=UPI00355984D1|nr:hypothetical protein MONOS_10092 [Monocercomonoides exilis]|eukprot:MONOS_10092.1-p1 / transcript=MONOS_10092.1 / gene=MONOS_10092 / organism=Monocercomonoides_exilis_PA203 / gene_product=unspecified product / transcript_product=unspecified product / location=Mono_scaffold00443:38682-40262(+) / protein_length=475 / sequence_SO=supercontig / SO=protein_coding / is_pseudo=false
MKDALNSSGWRVERYLIPAVKALIQTHADAPEKQERLSDAMMLVISGLQEARHSRIQAEYGFTAAKALRVETEDTIVSGEKLSKIKPFREARRARSQPSQHQLHNRRRFFSSSCPKHRACPVPNENISQTTATNSEMVQKPGNVLYLIRNRTQIFAKEWRSIGVKNTTTFGVNSVWKGKSEKEKLMKEVCLRRGFIGTRKEEEECAKWKSEKDHKTLEKLLRKDDYAVSIDLAQAHFLVSVHKDFTPFLAFGFRKRIFVFKGNHFGCKDAPRILSKLMRKIMQEVRKRWKERCLNYLDDVLLCTRTQSLEGSFKSNCLKAQQHTTRFQQREKQVNSQKHLLLPWKDMKTRIMKVALETKRTYSLQKKIKRWMNLESKETSIKTKDFASLVGEISATRLVYADASPHMNRLCKELDNAVRKTGWTGAMNLNYSIMEQLQYWRTRLREKEERQWVSFATPDVTLITDAAHRACGETL